MGRRDPLRHPRPRGRGRGLIVGALLLTLPAGAVSAQSCPPLPPTPWVINARAIDGDSLIEVGTRREVRLFGYDAPELRTGSPVALEATIWLQRLVGEHPVKCRPIEHDRYCRVVAICHTPDGGNLSYNMLAAGMGWMMRKYVYGTAYDADVAARLENGELLARKARRGVWRDVPLAP
jgi:endonuclease YncB( thermonuclease family)